MKEIFKDIPKYEGMYKVSNLGNVKSLKFGKEKLLKEGLSSNGYLTVVLYKYGSKITSNIHQLVAMAFLNHVPDGYKMVVNHINNNKVDNRVLNLEIVTQRENTNRKHLDSSSKYVGVHWDKNTRNWRARIRINGKPKHLGLFTDELEASKAYQKELLSINKNN